MLNKCPKNAIILLTASFERCPVELEDLKPHQKLEKIPQFWWWSISQPFKF